MSSWASSTPIWRWTWTSTRRSRSSTLRRLEQDLPLRRRDFDVAGHEVGEPARLVHPGEDLLHDLVGQSRLLAQLGGPDSASRWSATKAGSSGLSGSISSASRTMAWR